MGKVMFKKVWEFKLCHRTKHIEEEPKLILGTISNKKKNQTK